MTKSENVWGQAGRGLMISLAILMVGSGCAGADGNDVIGGTPELPAAQPAGGTKPVTGSSATAGINGTLLHTVSAGPDHAVYFYQLANGDTAVRESMPMGDEKPMLAELPDGMDLVAIFETISPGIEAPASLREADRLAVELAGTREAAAASDQSPLATPAQTRASEAVETQSSALSGAPPAACGPIDFNHDDWGGDWFINKYCVEGNYRLCVKNQTRLSTQRAGGGYKWIQNEGDFAKPGHIRGWHMSNCGPYFPFMTKAEYPVEDFNYDVLPRHIEIWTWATNARCAHGVEGSSDCGHMHVVNATQFP